METNNSVFKIPGVKQDKASNFVAPGKFSEIYDELNAISEEIEKCRLKNS